MGLEALVTSFPPPFPPKVYNTVTIMIDPVAAGPRPPLQLVLTPNYSPTSGHRAFARYYVRELKEPADRLSPDFRLIRLMLRNTDMCDDDIAVLVKLLEDSSKDHGADCAASIVEIMDFSRNPRVTVYGATYLLEALARLIEGSPEGHALQNLQAIKFVEPLSENPQGDDECSFKTSRALATAAVRLARLSNTLSVLCLPPMDEEEEELWVTSREEQRSKRAREEAMGRIFLDHDVAVEEETHPLSTRRTWFRGNDVELNVRLNTVPRALKDACLSIASNEESLMTVDLSGPLSDEDARLGKRFGPHAAELLAKALSEAKTIRTLDLSNNNRGEEATRCLVTALTTNRSLVDLRLRNNDLSTAAGLLIVAAIEHNCTLIELDLANNCCSDHVVDAFKKLIHANTSSIGYINWDGNPITKSSVSALYSDLMLNTQPKPIQHTIQRLQKGDLSLTHIMWNFAEPPVSDSSVKVLMQAIRGSTTVTHLDVSNSHITDEGAAYLADIVASCPKLRKLIVQFNYLSDEGAFILLHALPKGPSMEVLDLKFQQPDPISTKLLNSIEQVCRLSNQPVELQRKGLSIISNDPNCVAIDLSESKGLVRAADDSTVAALATLMEMNSCVESVNFSKRKGRITPRSLPFIASIAIKLKTLDLSSLDLGDDDVIEHIGRNVLACDTCKLESLILENNQLTSACSYELARIVRNQNCKIKSIRLGGNLAIAPQDIQLVDFYCSLNCFQPEFKAALLRVEANDRKLNEISFTEVRNQCYNSTSYGYEKRYDDLAVKLLCIALSQNSSVVRVIFTGNKCTDEGAKYWAQLLRVNITVTHLDVGYNEIGNDGLAEILESLKTNKSVKVFVYDGNPSKDPKLHKALNACIRSNVLAKEEGPYVSIHSLSKGHALSANALQGMEMDKIVDNAIFEDAMTDFNQQHRRKPAQQRPHTGSRLNQQKDASSILADIEQGEYTEHADRRNSTSEM